MLPRILALAQGAYFALTGVWPLVHMPSFLFVTGPKEDLWLVQAFGALVLGVGIAFLYAGRKETVPREVYVLGVATALALFLVDVVFYLMGILRWTYLLDAAAEVLLIAGWVIAWQLHGPRSSEA